MHEIQLRWCSSCSCTGPCLDCIGWLVAKQRDDQADHALCHRLVQAVYAALHTETTRMLHDAGSPETWPSRTCVTNSLTDAAASTSFCSVQGPQAHEVSGMHDLRKLHT